MALGLVCALLPHIAAVAALPAAEQGLSVPFHGPAAAPHSREIPLQGQSNFRDLGGYQTADGQKVKWGLIYRSGELSELSTQDYAKISRLHIRVVYDLRTAAERKRAPTAWAAGPVRIMQSPKTPAPFSSMSAEALEQLSPQAAKALMLALYRKMPEQYTPEFETIFHQLLENHAPLLLHCDAGKDRSGVASALILSALGVPRGEVMADYTLTNRYVTSASLARNPADRALLAHLRPDTAAVLVAADPAYLDAAFQSINQHYGSVDAYLASQLGVGPDQRARLRSLLLN
jgi:protein-tyrosine phosphatase